MALCAFDEGGKRLGHKFKQGLAEAASLQGPDATSLSTSNFFPSTVKTRRFGEPIRIISGTLCHELGEVKKMVVI
ncbi:hypothetical protein K443DRAFT_683056 [Laccaria amethystina LaAM-08-1]|uniref:Uncharacterized protein n=1 Tax=Laccaria amethystina LaAM-08-1 TaxID=1095629 RepID=A0A0C9WJW6_9AGAR|nr:hypothetical protein K443DRAFT_683056 [Laccaria amethystina LaAM-08-1]